MKFSIYLNRRVFAAEAVLTSTHNLCFEQKLKKNIRVFYLKILSVGGGGGVKNSIYMYLNRYVFVMTSLSLKYLVLFGDIVLAPKAY